MWFTYLLLCSDQSIYVGITNDLAKRFRDHKAGTGARYTRTRTPIKFLHFEKYRTRSRALKREAEIKKWHRREKLKLVQSAAVRGRQRKGMQPGA